MCVYTHKIYISFYSDLYWCKRDTFGFKAMHEIGCTRCQLLAGELEDLRSKDIYRRGSSKGKHFLGEEGDIDVCKGEHTFWLYMILSIYYIIVCR